MAKRQKHVGFRWPRPLGLPLGVVLFRFGRPAPPVRAGPGAKSHFWDSLPKLGTVKSTTYNSKLRTSPLGVQWGFGFHQ